VERKHPLAKCEECPLYLETGPVLGTGPEGAVKVAVVGEAPGFQEATVGRPFVGPSGLVLNEVLRNNDIDRKDVWATNAVACRPKDNATPTQDAIDACKPRLMAELSAHNPDYVLATGAVAAKALGLKGAMQNLRVGPPRDVIIPTDCTECDCEMHTLVVPTWHPAYTMRLPDAIVSLDFDVSKINKGTNSERYSEPTLTVLDDRLTALDAIHDLWRIPGPWSVDIETGVDKDDIDLHADQRPLLCIGVGYEPGKVAVFGKNVMDDKAVLEALGGLFRKRDLIMHNGKSDVAGLLPVMGQVKLRYDTMLEHYTLDERTGGHSLGQLGIELIGTPDWKTMVKPYLKKGKEKNFADIPAELLYRYNAIDCDVTYKLHQRFWPELERQGRTKAHDHMVRAANQLVYAEMDGIAFDLPYSMDLTTRLQAEIDAVEKGMAELVGREINPRSSQQLIRLFQDHGWYVPTGKERKPTTEAKAIKRALADGRYDSSPAAQEFITRLFEARDLSKDDGTYVRGMQNRVHLADDGVARIHTTFTLHVTTTGRLSSKDPNLQNIKDKDYLRRQFVAAPGNIFLQGDYSQIEGRVIAVLSGDPYLQSLFLDTERDIFDELSIALYGKLIKEKRRLLKTFFYGLSYGRTAHGIAKDPEFRMEVDDAQRQLDQFKELIPGVMEWQEKTWQTVQDQGYLETTFGRRRHFPLITNRNKDDVRNEALAFVPQSTASDICLSAFVQLRPALESYFDDSARIRLTIHDAIVTEVREDLVVPVGDLQAKIMETAGNWWAREQHSDVPFKVAFKRGTSWDQLD